MQRFFDSFDRVSAAASVKKKAAFGHFISRQMPVVMAGAFALYITQSANAQLTWDNAGPTNNWSTAAGNENWTPSPTVWVDGQDAIFGASPETVTPTTTNIVDDITFNDSWTIANGGAASINLTTDGSSDITVGSTFTSSIAEALSGTNALVKLGAGRLTLSGANSYTGATNVSVGTLAVVGATGAGNNLQLGTTPGTTGTSSVTVSNGATLLFDSSNATVTSAYTGNITISGSGVGGVGALNFGSGGTGARFTTGTVTIADGGSATFGSTRSGTGNIVNRITGGTIANPVTLTTTGPATSTSGGAGFLSWEGTVGNTYVGTVTVARGQLNLAAQPTAGNSAITGDISVSYTSASDFGILSLGRTNNQINDLSNVTIDGTFDLSNETNTGVARPRTETIGSLAGASTGRVIVSSSTSVTSGVNSGTLLTSALSGTATFNGVMQDGVGGRFAAFTKGGDYIQVLNGVNTYTGPTTVNGGTLIIGDAVTPGAVLATGSAVALNGGFLGGSGTVNGPITITAGGGKIAPGNSIGTLRADDVTWNSNDSVAGMFHELSTTDNTSDLLDLAQSASGTFIKEGTGTSYLFDFAGGLIGQTYTLVTFDTNTGFASGDFGIASTSPGYAGSFDLTLNSLTFTPTSVPEPTSLAIVGLGAIGLLARRRRTVKG